MSNMKNCSNRKTSSEPTDDNYEPLVPKPEMLDFEEPAEVMGSRNLGDHAASSSGSNVRSLLIGMGFLPVVVDKAIEAHGEDNVDLLLETLIERSNHERSNSQSSDSMDSLFDDKDESWPTEYATVTQVKEEPDALDAVDVDKRTSLLMMNFSAKEVEFAIDKHGEDAPISEIVDFIIAAQVAETLEGETQDMPSGDVGKNEESNDEILYGTMEKTLRLLELGFSENEISLAIETLGSEVPIPELADWICAYQVGDEYIIKNKHSSNDSTIKHSQVVGHHSYGTVRTKTENCSQDAVSQSRYGNMDETHKSKRPKQEYVENCSDTHLRHNQFEDNYKGKLPKQESNKDYEPAMAEEKIDPKITSFGLSKALKPSSCKIRHRMVVKPPYFFYANVLNASSDMWGKISQFLYGIEPEFVNTQYYSALSRKEGYVHNLPTENRFHILPKPPMTIEDAIPRTKKWWPSWDTRKQLSCINSETSGVTQLCERLGRMLVDSRGLLSSEQKRDILHHCQTSNLMWVGPNKLAPMEPERLEHILGYPLNHTQADGSSLTERLHSLRYCFQTDTLGYHLSVLKPMFPEGIVMLSLFSGIGGAEIALHRLGIHLKGVVSVETSETMRKILRRWWQSSGQTGRLEQVEDIQRLTINKMDKLIEKFGGFDFVVCQNYITQSSKIPKLGPDREDTPIFDFPLFYEFVRVLQRVKSTPERKT